VLYVQGWVYHLDTLTKMFDTAVADVQDVRWIGELTFAVFYRVCSYIRYIDLEF
jgi:hypothetical protein